MAPLEYLSKRLRDGMFEGNMHGCLRDVGRLAGGYLAAGSLTSDEVNLLESAAISLSLNKTEGATKWNEAVEFGRQEPVPWDQSVTQRLDRALDWNDPIGDTDYQIIDPQWIEAIETVEPEIWDPVAQISTYLTTLFSSEEHVGYVTQSWEKDGRRLPSRGNYDRTAGQLLEELAKYKDVGSVFGDIDPAVGAWIRFNPLDGQGIRDSNVTDFRYALVESDSMPIEQQRGVYDALELPIAALVHSGNKSLHAIVRIEANDLNEYKHRVDLLYAVCAKNGLIVDRQNKNPSRLSRLPGCLRGERKQYLEKTNIGKPSWAAWEDWIEAVNDDLPNPETLADVWEHLPPLAKPLIDGVLRQGHKMLVSGPSKSGKSFLLAQLCISIAEGREWLGWQCTPGRVLYVNLELDRASCLHRFRDVYTALGWSPNNISQIDIWNLRGQSVPMDRLAPKLIRRALKKQYSAVIIDPIYKVITGDENSAEKMAIFCNQFDRVCHELAAAVIYCHHHSKGVQGGKRSMDRASGSGVFARDPDALLDMIELVISKGLKKAQENLAVCALISRELDLSIPNWRLDIPEDDAQVEGKLMSFAARIIGQRWQATILPQIVTLREIMAMRTAWRVDGTFREYPKAPPVNCWFAYPRHILDGDSGEKVLDMTNPQQDEPPWKAAHTEQQKHAKSRTLDRALKLQDAFNVLAVDGVALLKDVAPYVERSQRTVREWAEEIPGWVVTHSTLSRQDPAEGPVQSTQTSQNNGQKGAVDDSF